MKFKPAPLSQAACLFLAVVSLQTTSSAAQPPLAEPRVHTQVRSGERLSDWLLRQTNPQADTTALQWQVPAEQAPQEKLRQATIQSVLDSPAVTMSPAQRKQLADWLLALPITGRLTVALADPRWLQSAPEQDPILQAGQRVLLLPRPHSVTLVTETGLPCVAQHVSGALVQDYLHACWGDKARTGVDWAWISQPDGRTQRNGIAPWNAEPQAEPGPGAWIWAPQRAAGIPNTVSDNLARFLATQLPGEHTLSTPLIQTQALLPARPPPSRTLPVSASDWGEIGLLQTPTARMATSGDLRFVSSHVAPYTRATVMFQRMDWLEAGFRYTDVGNQLYGADIAGTQTYKDKSLDLKLRLLKEDDVWPQLALGVRDLGGTGLFSGEYLVANKRWGNWDVSLGLGWGYLGARGNLKNPLSFLGEGYKTRPVIDPGLGGTASLDTLLHGRTALLGGVQWHTPLAPWVVKLELDGNDYQNEPQNNKQPSKTPLNLGAVYRYSPYIDLSLGLERGQQWMLGFTVHGGLDRLQSPKLLDPVLAPVRASSPSGTAETITLFTGWEVRSLSDQANSTTLVAETDGAVHLQERIDRAIAVLNRDAPATSTRLVLHLQERGLPMSHVEVDRAEWVRQRTQVTPPALRLPVQSVMAAQTEAASTVQAGAWAQQRPSFSAEWGPSYSQILGGPDSFFLYQLGLQAMLEQRFSDSTWLSSNVEARLLDNFSQFKFDAPSGLPRVRTYQREYVTAAALTLPLLQLTHVQDLGRGHYVSAYGGMLEQMFGGVGAEWLYRPWQGRLAWGVDVNQVRQRDFNQNLAWRDYRTSTGHATLYWDTGWNEVQLTLSAGRYLAGDVGATLDLKRVFSNGVAAGAWATQTNASADAFGEGSFDKGLYITIPFDVMLPKSTAGNGTLVWNPLTRDGGARLNRSVTLNALTRQRARQALSWHSLRPQGDRSAEDNSYVLSEPSPSIFGEMGESTVTLGQQIGALPASAWWWAGAAIGASSLLDKPLDQWAQKHQDGSADHLGTLSNALPGVLTLGAGLLLTGLGGQPAASTAETAIKAAAYTYAANWGTRYVVGRARPTEELGNASFNGFNNSASQSSMASNHVAVAFALATPFAQAHDLPWLYGVAAASAYGRVQQRDHWFSDTVAGGLMGYAIGSMLTDQQLHRETGVRWNIGAQSVQASWSFK